MTFNKRIKKLQKLIDKPTLVSHPDDVFYYTGLDQNLGENAFLLVKKSGKPIFFLNQLITFKQPSVTIEPPNKFISPKKLAIDESHIPTGTYLKLKKKSSISKAAEIIKKPRLIKEPEEIELMKKAIKINKKIFSSIEFQGTEADIAKKIEIELIKNNSTLSFPSIVSSGPNAGNHIHHFPGSRKINKKDMIIIDMGAKYKGYCSDITRTWINPKDSKQRKIFEAVKEIQQECINLAIPGATIQGINSHFTNSIKKKDYQVRHGIGHGIGISVHEPFPRLEKGMVITIEPGIYIPGYGGCRLEDMIIIKNKSKVLSHSIPQDFV